MPFNQKIPPELIREAVKLQNKGWTQERIAAEFGLHHKSMSRALVKYNHRVMDRMIDESVAAKGRQLQILANLVDELYRAWDKSKLDAQIVEQSQSTGGKGKDKIIVRKTIKGQCGNPAFLSEVVKCLEVERKILVETGSPLADIKATDKRMVEAMRQFDLYEKEQARLKAELGTDDDG